MYTIKDKYVKIRNIDGKFYAIHLFTGKILYNPYTNYMSSNMAEYTKKRIIEDIKRDIDFYNSI